MTKMCTSYTRNVTGNLNLNFVKKNSSTPWHGAVDEIGGVKHVHQNMPADHLTGLCWPS